jgi:hypothetical protein
MTLPDLPEDDQEANPISDEGLDAGEQLKWKRKVGIYLGKFGHNQGETGENLNSLVKENPSSRLAAGIPSKAVPKPLSQTDGTHISLSHRSTKDGSVRDSKDINPGRRLHAFEAAAKNAPAVRIPWQYRLRPNREQTHRAYWDVAATFSLIINAFLIGILIIMAGQIKNLRTTVNGLFGGLYSNFVKMDQATINTTFMVNAQIPLDLRLPISQNTEVVLTRDVSIPGAHVVINTGILNINAKANISIPAGTTLPIALNLEVPVHSMIPISLQVPVSIPMNQTGLHEPFTGLQTSLRPLYCMLDRNAQYPAGIYICTEHDAPIPGTP